MTVVKIVLATLLAASAATALGLWFGVKAMNKKEGEDRNEIKLKRMMTALSFINAFVLLCGVAVIVVTIVENVNG